MATLSTYKHVFKCILDEQVIILAESMRKALGEKSGYLWMPLVNLYQLLLGTCAHKRSAP